jgi:hypothetical protein
MSSTRVCRARQLVEAQEGEARRVGAPPVGPVGAAAVDLLLIHPVQLPVQDLIAPVGGHGALPLGGQVDQVEVVAPHEGHPDAVGTEGRLLLGFGGEGEPEHAVCAKRIGVEVAGDEDAAALLVMEYDRW